MFVLGDGAYALSDCLVLRGEALVCLASVFHVLRHLLQACGRLGWTTWTTLCRGTVSVAEVLVHPVERLFSLRNGLGGRSLFDGQRR